MVAGIGSEVKRLGHPGQLFNLLFSTVLCQKGPVFMEVKNKGIFGVA
jgi:hypothetical protein